MTSTSLRDYQRTPSARLVNPDAARSASKLGVQVGANRWLIDLADTAEVIPAPAPAPVPLTCDWFLGVTSVRGNLYGVVDFRGFTEGVAAKPTEHSACCCWPQIPHLQRAAGRPRTRPVSRRPVAPRRR